MDDDSPLQISVHSPRSDYEIESESFRSTSPPFDYVAPQEEDDEPDTPPPFDSLNPEEPVTQNVDADEDDALPPADAIGNTLYSELFVVGILTKLMDFEGNLKDDQPFERQLGQLWDMTSDRDVVLFLIEHSVMELFVHHIENTQDERLTEILVGIVANMCTMKESGVALSKNIDLLKQILSLLSCTDVPTLIQVIRLLNAVAKVFPRPGGGYEDKLFRLFIDVPTIMENICGLLNNSLNEMLLVPMLTTLDALAERFVVASLHIVTVMQDHGVYGREPYTFLDMFVNERVISSLNEAFNTLFPETQTQSNNVETSESLEAPQSPARAPAPAPPEEVERYSPGSDYYPLSPGGDHWPTDNKRKAMLAFLSIHRINLEYFPETTYEFYKPYVNDVFKCISRALKPLCDKSYLLPLEKYHVDMVSDVNSIFANCYYPFDELCFRRMVTIWCVAFEKLAGYSRYERRFIEADVDINLLFSSLYMFVQCTSSRANDADLIRVVDYFNLLDISMLLKEIKKCNLADLHGIDINRDPTNPIRRDDEKLRNALRSLLTDLGIESDVEI